MTAYGNGTFRRDSKHSSTNHADHV